MFTPHTKEDLEAMLETIGVAKIDELFNCLPADHMNPELDLPPALTEMEVLTELQDIAWANDSVRELVSFLGAGAYNHYSPAVVDSILRRGEFYTAYTPYQPEISQGTLQAIFEFQTAISRLLAMDVANASMTPLEQQQIDLADPTAHTFWHWVRFDIVVAAAQRRGAAGLAGFPDRISGVAAGLLAASITALPGPANADGDLPAGVGGP